MKRLKTLLVVTALAGIAGAIAGDMITKGALAIGSTAPMADTKLKNVDGNMLSIADAKGAKGTLVLFSCNHCPFVIAWEDRIVALGNAAQAAGVGVIQINSNDPSAHAEDGFDQMVTRAKEKGMQFPYVVDGTSGIAKAFGATRTPEAFLFDASGKLVYHGTIDDNVQDAAAVKETYLKNAIDAVASGKAPAVKETKAIGCGIKFRS
ncbi:MAG: thioredoxin family protein [Acidobacteriota bacterium]